MNSVIPDATGMMGINPAILDGAPPWAAGVLNMLQNLTVEVEVLKFALQRRALLTDQELTEARMLVSQKLDEVFLSTVQGIERELNQRVNQPATQPNPPDDPRRSPT